MRSQRKVLFAAFVAAVAGGLLTLNSVPGRAGEGHVAGRGDCSFLERPEEFLEAQEARREQIRELTFAVAQKLGQRQEAVGPLTPRNLVDVYTFAKMQRDGVAPARLSSDTEFLRRVHLDLTGRIPASSDVRAFLENNNPNKRDQVIDSLIGSPEYVDRWTMFYGDLLGNIIVNTNINRYFQGRNAFYEYIKASLAENKPYHSFVGEMLVASGTVGSRGR